MIPQYFFRHQGVAPYESGDAPGKEKPARPLPSRNLKITLRPTYRIASPGWFYDSSRSSATCLERRMCPASPQSITRFAMLRPAPARLARSFILLTISVKPVGVGAASHRLIPTGERSGLQTHIATMESVSLFTRMKIDCVSGTGIGDSGRDRVKRTHSVQTSS